MNRSDQNGASPEVTLDDLYANELNVALSWDHEHGFHATLGNPPLAKRSFPTSGQAVRWLKEQALRHFPRAKFRTEGPDTAGREAVLDHLRASHIAGSISWTWDGGFYAELGAPKRAEKWAAASTAEILAWLREQAIQHYPDSEFANRSAGFGPLS